MLEVEATSQHGHTANGSGENRHARRFVAIWRHLVNRGVQ